MAILGWIIAGFIIGIIARLIHPGKDPGGFIVTVLLGIGGALLAGFLGRALGFYQPNEPVGYLASIVGAVVILVIYSSVRGRREIGRAT